MTNIILNLLQSTNNLLIRLLPYLIIQMILISLMECFRIRNHHPQVKLLRKSIEYWLSLNLQQNRDQIRLQADYLLNLKYRTTECRVDYHLKTKYFTLPYLINHSSLLSQKHWEIM